MSRSPYSQIIARRPGHNCTIISAGTCGADRAESNISVCLTAAVILGVVPVGLVGDAQLLEEERKITTHRGRKQNEHLIFACGESRNTVNLERHG